MRQPRRNKKILPHKSRDDAQEKNEMKLETCEKELSISVRLCVCAKVCCVFEVFALFANG